MKRINNKNLNTKEILDKEFIESSQFQEFNYTDIYRIDKFLENFKGGKLLDIGCWNLPTAYEAKKRNPDSEVYCMDISTELIKFYKTKCPELNYLEGDCNKPLPFEDESFDQVVAGEVLEHTEDPKEVIKEILRVLKKGGYFTFSVPYREMIVQKSVGGPWHLWSFDEFDFAEIFFDIGEFVYEIEKQRAVITLIGTFKKK